MDLIELLYDDIEMLPQNDNNDTDVMDGKFKNVTEIVVKDFQKETGELKIDGIVGPKKI